MLPSIFQFQTGPNNLIKVGLYDFLYLVTCFHGQGRESRNFYPNGIVKLMGEKSKAFYYLLGWIHVIYLVSVSHKISPFHWCWKLGFIQSFILHQMWHLVDRICSKTGETKTSLDFLRWLSLFRVMMALSRFYLCVCTMFPFSYKNEWENRAHFFCVKHCLIIIAWGDFFYLVFSLVRNNRRLILHRRLLWWW